MIAELVATAAQHLVVGIGRHRPGRNAQALFHSLEPGRHGCFIMPCHTVHLCPMRQGLWRGAKAAGPVDQRGTADRTALEDGDGAVLAHAADSFLIERRVGVGFLHLEVVAGLQWAFFDQQHLVTRRAEDFRRGATTGAAADDGDIGFQRQIVFQTRTVVCLPAPGQALLEQIGYGHFEFSCCYGRRSPGRSRLAGDPAIAGKPAPTTRP